MYNNEPCRRGTFNPYADPHCATHQKRWPCQAAKPQALDLLGALDASIERARRQRKASREARGE